MVKNSPEKALTDFFQSEEENTSTVSTSQLVLAHERDVIPANEVENFFVDAQKTIAKFRAERKAHWYWFASVFYQKAEGMTDKAWRDRWRETIGEDYPQYINYARAIHAWRLGVPDYPRAISVYLLTRSYKLSKRDKLTFVAMFNQGVSQKELAAWAQSRLCRDERFVDVNSVVSAFVKDYDKSALAAALLSYREQNPRS